LLCFFFAIGNNGDVKFTWLSSFSAVLILGLAATANADAQAVATASRRLSPSAFAMGTVVYTGLDKRGITGWRGGRNLSWAAGFDLGVFPMGRYVLAAEVRGRYAVDRGDIAGERVIFGGARISREPSEFHNLRPYVDALIGRGQMDYQHGGYQVGNLLYTRTAGAVYGAGVGVEYDLTRHYSAKADGQLEHWSTPVASGGSTHSSAISLGLVYRFGAGDFPR
jgi:hypothetical protein